MAERHGRGGQSRKLRDYISGKHEAEEEQEMGEVLAYPQ